MGYSVGIDLGTMYSAAAVAHDGRVETFTLGTTATVIPSVVLLREDGQVLTGEAAERRAVSEPTRTAREFKRRLGDPVPLILGGTPYGAEALMAHLLRAIVDAVTERQGEPPTRIVLTHPANYSDYKTSLLEEAARQAGLDLARVRFISEPEAAAISYSSQQRVEPGEVVAIYDFGGGTFDAALVRKTADGFELVGNPEGMERLGGVDIDQAVLAHVDQSLDGLLSQLDDSDASVRSATARLRDECREAKEALSTDTDTAVLVSLPNVQTEVRLTREELEDMIRPRVRETVDALSRAVASAGLSISDVSRVLLVGGSSRIPLVGQMVRDQTGRPVTADAHPKLSVATGAALAYAGDEDDAVATAATTAATTAASPSTGATAATAAVGGVAAAGVGAGAAVGAVSHSGASAAASGSGPGSMASAPGVMHTPPGTMHAGAGKMAGASHTKAIVIGAVVAVVAAAGAFVAVRAATSSSSSSTTTTEVAAGPAAPGVSPPSSASQPVSAGRGLDGIVTTVAGNGNSAGTGIPGDALQASLGTTADIAVAPNGDIYIAERSNRILRVSGGQISEAYVANTAAGEAGFQGVAVGPDGTVMFGTGRGIARLDGPNTATLVVDRQQQDIAIDMSLAYGPDGTLYAASAEDGRVYAIQGGTAVPVAGDGQPTPVGQQGRGDGGPATAAGFTGVRDIAVSSNGTIYVSEDGGQRVRAFTPGGTITTVAGGGTTPIANAAQAVPDGTSPTDLLLEEPAGLAVAQDGMVYVTDSNSHVIFRFQPGEGIEIVIADVGGVTAQNGKPANQTLAGGGIEDLAIEGDTLFFANGFQLRQIQPT